ncbi:hypothetical protein [Zobellia nedashkovskayae]|uniref:hypothetical protein n=1 Tax=Zobellia nedashkovskayae TaxID=2779510 RepID=UPI00188DA0F3|nr:hypothetical protein [Zobellia nedashkovskayae]
MKELKIISVLAVLVLSLVVIEMKSNAHSLKVGDISFTSMKSTTSDGFSITTAVKLPPRTKIRFTDSEWNGNHFGFDESDILWETGNDTINANSEIKFTNLNSTPSVSIGSVYGSMRISKKEDAIFAYTGNERTPMKILAACANDEFGFGTLINTSLTKGTTALLFQ